MKLLIIDDDKPSLKTLAATLTMLGFECEAFDDPQDGFSRFKTGNVFDAVITDLRMPGLSGVEILDKIRDIDPAIPMILITAYRDKMPEKADRIFYKPIDIQALVSYLKQL